MSTSDQEGKHFGVVRELRNQYSASKSAGFGKEELARLQAQASEIIPELAAWRERFPAIATSRLKPAVMSLVVAWPDATREQLLLLSKVGLMVFSIDDVADGEIGSLKDEDLLALLDRYIATTRDPEAVDWVTTDEVNTIGASLQDVTRLLRRAPGAARFLPLWQEHFRRMCSGYQVELKDKRRNQADGTLPSLDSYLEVGKWTVGASMVFTGALVVQNPPFEQTQAPLLERALGELGLATRWMNDVRSLDRERAEGKFNSLGLLMVQGLSEADAEREAVERSDRHLAALEDAVRQLPDALRTWGRMLVMTGHFSRSLYMKQEFHHTEPGAGDKP
ncbi:MAG TPA: terpene synthase family protein [Archangium sp.]|jgi:hypothetical protein|uniref:terpene synthase family protein n=1 Tax=Archangium sp. TaxID=1872627 RepID=UPI002EDB181B